MIIGEFQCVLSIDNMTAIRSKKKVVILLHGIRTRAWWQGPVSSYIRDKTGATVIPIKYDRYDLFKFLLPFDFAERRTIDSIHKKLNEIFFNYKNYEITIIAHSFGTYVISKILEKNPNVYFDKIILCGSIVKKDFNWNSVQTQIGKHPHREYIINECGVRDPFPILASSVTWGYGSSGTDGFGGVKVRDRYHELSHSEFLNIDFVERYWIDFINDDKIEASRSDRIGSQPPWYFNLFRIKYKYLIPAAMILSIFLLMEFQVRSAHRTFEFVQFVSDIADLIHTKLPSFETGFEQQSFDAALLDDLSIFQECNNCPSMQIIEGGTYFMGNNRPKSLIGRRRVSIKKMAVARFEISRQQYAATKLPIRNLCKVTSEKGDYNDIEDDQYPISCISWEEAKAYVDFLNLKLKRTPQSKLGKYRLPTEAEFEYFMHRGSAAEHFYIDSFFDQQIFSEGPLENTYYLCEMSNIADKSSGYEWKHSYCDDGTPDMAPANPINEGAQDILGLYNISGNVSEWTSDCWNIGHINRSPNGNSTHMERDCEFRIVKGGNFKSRVDELRSGVRSRFAVNTGFREVGFRVVLDLN